MPNGADQLDTRIEIITPENIAFQYRVAGPFRRLPAYILDVVIRLLLIIAGSLIFSFTFGMVGLPGLSLGLILILWFALSWFYGGMFETFWNGQTPGKRMMRIRVVSVDGQPINGVQATARNFLLVVDALPAFVLNIPLFAGTPIPLPLSLYFVGMLTALMNNRFQRLGDLAAGTMVVLEEGYGLRGLVQLNEPEVAQLAAQIPVNYLVKRSLARALSAYVERRGSFAWGRRMEIAWHVAEPLRDQFNLPPNTNLDLLLCALYYRTFITDKQTDEPVRVGSPFAESNNPFAFLEVKESSPSARV
jgi:uncharacterized RDD family membrane protein YckC